MEGALSIRQVVNKGNPSFVTTKSQQELEENPSPIVNEDNVVSVKNGPNLHYACALQRDILLQGRLYLSENWLCFHSNIFRWETTISIALKNITFMTKEKTARLIPNAIQIVTEGEKIRKPKKSDPKS